jgi:hypothetical protein
MAEFPPNLAAVEEPRDGYGRAYDRLTLLMQAIVCVALGVFVLRRDWPNVFLTAVVVALMLIPLVIRRWYRVYIPPEFQLVSAGFVFLSLYLGSVRGYYSKFWWWDVALHTSSGFILGVAGFVTLFLLNRTDRIPPGIRPGFLCFFGVTFAVFLGVVWEVFEYACDVIAPRIGMTSNMQSTESGVNDTMHDLIVDTLGAVVVALMGWAYLRKGRYSFLADGVKKFLARNPKLFRKGA